MFDKVSPNLVHQIWQRMQDGSAQYLKKPFHSVTKFVTQKHQGKAKTECEPVDIDLIFKITVVI